MQLFFENLFNRLLINLVFFVFEYRQKHVGKLLLFLLGIECGLLLNYVLLLDDVILAQDFFNLLHAVGHEDSAPQQDLIQLLPQLGLVLFCVLILFILRVA